MEQALFLPPRWLQGGHLQTLTCAMPWFAPAKKHRALSPESRWFHSGNAAAKTGVLARVWMQEKKAPAVILIHGVGGSDSSLYVIRAASAFFEAGYHVFRLNQRGAGDGVEKAAGLYHAGLTEDLDAMIRELGHDERITSVHVVGFSGGGNVALKLAGEWGSAAPRHLKGIVSLSAPVDLARAAANIVRKDALPYHAHVLRGLLRGAVNLKRRAPERAPYAWRDLLSIRSLTRFDRKVTVPMHGFDSVEAYYASASAGPWLSKIAVPTLAIHAEDDPMVPGSTVRDALSSASSHVHVEYTDHGGHLGWVGGMGESAWTRTWAVGRALRFFEKKA
ncbi:MAG: alpha/beta fold hydrolase [Polyangiaceae bacterium]